jgi:hypothetical protein
MGARRRGSAAGSVVLALLLLATSACGGDGTSAGATSPSRIPSAVEQSTEPAPATATAEPEGEDAEDPASTTRAADDGDTTSGLGELAPGSHVGRLTEVRDGMVDGVAVQVIGFDKVDFLTGQEAVEAAREAGYIGPDEDSVPNDYYVRNVNPLVRLLPVAPGSPVLVLDGGSPRLVPGDLEQALAAGSLVRIELATVDGLSTVTAVEGVYVP